MRWRCSRREAAWFMIAPLGGTAFWGSTNAQPQPKQGADWHPFGGSSEKGELDNLNTTLYPQKLHRLSFHEDSCANEHTVAGLGSGPVHLKQAMLPRLRR